MTDRIEHIVDSEHPWPGMMSYDEASKDYFHGRGDETQTLVRLIRRHVLTSLFGRSGLGKSSLLKAGLFPVLREREYLPIYIRLDVGNDTLPLIDQVKDAIARGLADNDIEARAPRKDESLWEYFHDDQVDFWTKTHHLITCVLVFDQFEEIFTLLPRDMTSQEDNQRLELVTALAELVENRTPPSLVRRMEDDPEISKLYDFNKKNCNIVFSFREDYLGNFEELAAVMPSIMTNRMRLTCMTGQQALEAVDQSGGHLIDEGVAEEIIQFVARGEDSIAEDGFSIDALEIEPALLSVICRELNNKRIEFGQEKITSDLLAGHHDSIISNFYFENIADVPPECSEFIEEYLLTESGQRDSCAMENVAAIPGVNEKDISELVNRRLLRYEDRFGVKRVELTHDLLANVARENRDKRRLDRETREQQRRQKRRFRLAAFCGAAVLLFAVGLGITALTFYNIADQNQKDRERLLDYLADLTTEICDQIRFYPGASDLTQYLLEDINNFASEWEAKAGTGSEATARLNINNLLIQAQSAMMHGEMQLSQEYADSAEQAIARVEAAGMGDAEWLRWLKFDLQLRLASLHFFSQRQAQAAKHYNQAMALTADVALDSGKNRRRYARALSSMAWSLLRVIPEKELPEETQRRMDEARAMLERYKTFVEAEFARWEDWANTHTADQGAADIHEWVLWTREMGRVHMRYANLYEKTEEYDRCEHEYRQNLALVDRLKKLDPFNSRINYAWCNYSLAKVLLKSGKVDEAQTLLAESERTTRSLAELDENVAFWPNMHAEIVMTMGDVQRERHASDAAVGCYRQAEAMLLRQMERFPQFGRSKRTLGEVRERMAALGAAQ